MKDNRKFDWVIVLTKGNWHAKGLYVCRKTYYDYSEGFVYKYGDWIVFKENVTKEWKLNSFTLLWNSLVAECKPTLKDRLKKFFLHKEYPKEADIRPENNTLVIARYDIGTTDVHYEMVEYNDRRWITNLSFPVKPDFWAYVPRECINEAELLNRDE